MYWEDDGYVCILRTKVEGDLLRDSDPADVIACLRANPDAAAEVLTAMTYRASAEQAECDRLRERVRVLEAALRPFAGLPVRGDTTMLLIGADEVNEARAALEGTREQ